MNVGLEGCYVI